MARTKILMARLAATNRLTATRYNLRIKVGTYNGNGIDSTNITGIGFRPQFILVKGGANVACIRVDKMRGDASISMSSALAAAADQIQEILNDGFQVGTSALVNANGTAYFYVAIAGVAAQSYFRTGNYRGTGGDDRNFITGGLNFTPDLVGIWGDTAQQKRWKSSSMVGDLTQYFGGVAGGTNGVQNLQSNGFQLGTSVEVNSSGIEYFFMAMKALSGIMAVGTYAGDGIDNKNISGVTDFQPDAIIVKRDGASQGRLLTADMSADNSSFLGASAAAANGIQSILSTGFQVGTDNSVNNASSTYYWMAFKSGNFNVPTTRLTV